ncbi:hypothetical protein BKA70DRAFT_1225298 [Coprinopsis sp. MPI-PUGE-AT-0042]|nr:hypothetical protein BKA70DRAFT_1225298 [Coprinopsis sp. MPI-PUGE-AT-0042]
MSFYAGSAGSVGSVVMQPQQIQGSAYGVPMAQSMMPQGYPMTQSVSYAHHVPPPIQVMPMTAAMPARPQAYYQAPAMLPPVPHTAAPVMYAPPYGMQASYGYYGQQPTLSSPAAVTAATSAQLEAP